MKFALIGAELRGLDVHANYERTCELRNELIKRGLSFVGVQNVVKTRKHQMFLVETTDETEVSLIATIFGQKAILISDEANNTEAVSTQNSTKRRALGKLVAVTKAEAISAKFHITFQEQGKDYYYVTNKGIDCD